MAAALLRMNSAGVTAESIKAAVEDAGFTVLRQKHYGKDSTDRTHTSAYTFAKGIIDFGEETRTVYMILVLHTCGGEWYSNVDFAPSHSDNAIYAENFKAAADEILNDTLSTVSKDPDALLLISGHSRGGSVANLLGLAYNDARNTALNYIYPVAPAYNLHTPADESVQIPEFYGDNIFNIVNSADLVTAIPMKSMGFYRAGNDVVITAASGLNSKMTSTEKKFASICTSISSYYNDKHSLTGMGLSEDGITVYELMTQIVGAAFVPGMDMSNIMNSELVSMIMDISSDSDLYPIRQLATEIGVELGLAQWGVTPNPNNSYTGMLATHEAASYIAALEAMIA